MIIEEIVLNSDNAFEANLIKMVEMHRRKNKDYAGADHTNQNFYDSGYQMGLTGGHGVEALIATKQARLRVLLPQFWSNPTFTAANEGLEDTLLDRAIYSVIAMTIWSEGGYLTATSPKVEPPVQESMSEYFKKGIENLT